LVLSGQKSEEANVQRKSSGVNFFLGSVKYQRESTPSESEGTNDELFQHQKSTFNMIVTPPKTPNKNKLKNKP